MVQLFLINMYSIFGNSGFYMLAERVTGLNDNMTQRKSPSFANGSLRRDLV